MVMVAPSPVSHNLGLEKWIIICSYTYRQKNTYQSTCKTKKKLSNKQKRFFYKKKKKKEQKLLLFYLFMGKKKKKQVNSE